MTVFPYLKFRDLLEARIYSSEGLEKEENKERRICGTGRIKKKYLDLFSDIKRMKKLKK